MADILLRDLSPELCQRLEKVAGERGCPVEAVIMDLLRQTLGLTPRVPIELSRLVEFFKDEESRALSEAIAAMEGMPDDTFLDPEEPLEHEPR